jgi:hypothetical protein
LSRPVADLDDFLETAPDVGPRAPFEPAPEAPRRRPGAAWSIMAVAATLVVVGVGYWMLREQSAPDAAAGTMSAPDAPATSVGVPGFAEMYLASYLAGTAEAIGEFLPGAPPLPAMTPAGRYVTRAATLEIATIADGYWRVMVAADVLTLQDGAYHAAGIQYFQVGVIDDGGRLVAATLPSRVAGPARRPAPPRNLQSADGAPTDAHLALVGDFLEALLTDRRDIERYVDADGGIDAISPAPYQTTVVTSIALYGDGSALVAVDARDAGGAVDSMQYVIRFSHEGPLSVTGLLAGPPSIMNAGPGQS